MGNKEGAQHRRANEKKKRFAVEYFRSLNGTQSAIKAGYAPKSAQVTASRLLMDAKVQAHLQEMRRATEKRATVTKAHVIDELGIVALSDIGEVFTQSVDGRYITVRSLDDLSHAARRCIKSIRQTTHEQQDAEGRFVEKVQIQVELHPKVQALDLLMAHFGLKQAEKIDVHVNVASAKVRLAEKLNDLRERNQPQPDEPGGETGA